MGKVYSWEKIEGGNIPKIEQFLVAKRMILDNLPELIPNDIYGAKVFGSVAKDSPSIRSDFDLLVVFNSELGIRKLNNLVQEVDKKTNVEVEPLILSVQQASEGLHTIDPNFYKHFKGIPNEGNLVGNNPLNKIRPLEENEMDFCMNYIRQKIRRLNQGHFEVTEVKLLNLLLRVLESPVAVSRKVLSVLQSKGKFKTDKNDDGKKSVIKNFDKLMNDLEIDPSDFYKLISKDKEYTLFLEETLNQKHSQKEYQQFLNEIKDDSLPLAKNWITKTGVWLKNVVSN